MLVYSVYDFLRNACINQLVGVFNIIRVVVLCQISVANIFCQISVANIFPGLCLASFSY